MRSTDHDVRAGPTPIANVVAPSFNQHVELFEFDADSHLCGFESTRGKGANMFLKPVEIDDTFRENSVDERARAGQQFVGCLGGSRGGSTVRRGVDCGMHFVNLLPLFVKLARGQLCEATLSVCHQRELNAEREMRERLELVITNWYHLLAFFIAVAQKRCIVADQNNHGNIVAELHQDLLDDTCVGLVEADVNGGKQTVMRREFTRFGKFALRIRIRAVHAFVASNVDRLPATAFRESLAIPECFKANCLHRRHMLRGFIILLMGCLAGAGLAEDPSVTKFRSPDGHFGLRVADLKVDLIEIASGKVMIDLGTLWINKDDSSDKEEPQLVWSDDSKWIAYGTRTSASGSTAVYFWDGSDFKKLALPAKLPEPKIKPREGDSDVKLKGYAEEPLKWIHPGELEISNKLMGVGREVGFRYTGSIVITVAFDPSGRASIKRATDTKTEVSE